MNVARSAPSATLFPNGEVLVAGGYGAFAIVASAELYDPTTNIWSPAGSMSQARWVHTATLLGNGNVLVAGGDDGFTLDSAELYSPTPSLGTPCALASDCQSGFCADGVCCNSACNAGPCDACSFTAGAAANGTCVLLTGPACNDGDGCTQSDTCQAGVCTGGPAVICAPPDPCHNAGTCDPVKGCISTAKPDGAACGDGDACTQGDTCQAGVCTGGVAVVCTALDTCHVPGKCDPATGVCTNLVKPDTAACDDGNACTQADTCLGGVCKGANPIDCAAADECHGAGTCDSKTGVCSTMAKPDGAPCAGGTCNAGICASTPDGGSSSSSSSSASSGGGNGGSGGTDTTGSSSSGSVTPGMSGGCGCGVVGSSDLHPTWLALGLLLARRRRARGASPRRGRALETS
jgi:uncharacterized membrane protein YgcG